MKPRYRFELTVPPKYVQWAPYFVLLSFSSYLVLKKHICLCKCLGYFSDPTSGKSFCFIYLFFVWEGVSPNILIFFRHTSSVLPHLSASKFGSHISSCSICDSLFTNLAQSMTFPLHLHHASGHLNTMATSRAMIQSSGDTAPHQSGWGIMREGLASAYASYT